MPSEMRIFTRASRKGYDTESIPGLLGKGMWQRLKTGHAPNVAMGTVPASRDNRRINAANVTRIREHGVSSSSFAPVRVESKIGRCLSLMWPKALKSVATTCDGDGGRECHVLFTKRGGTIVDVSDMGGSYTVGMTGIVKGAGELTASDRTANVDGMEVLAYVGQSDKSSEGFVWPVSAPSVTSP